MIEKLMKKLGFILLIVAATVTAVLFLLGYRASQKYVLEPWHQAPQLEDKFDLASFNDFGSYLEEEEKLIDQIYDSVQPENAPRYNKYGKNNASSPYRNGKNLNASFEFMPEDGEIVGGILLVHGLTDSPYHFRSVGKLFAENGYYVIGLRLPGHGTVPGALLDVSWADWYDAVKFGARMASNKAASVENGNFYVGGFSTGGALTLRYTLESISDKATPVPDKLLLLSPAIGVSPFAQVTDWHKLTSWLFEEFKWLDIIPEYDPYKYNSFAKNAADQIFDLTKANWELINGLAGNQDALSQIPPIVAFQSAVDATVSTVKLLEMFGKVASPESELYLFDVNRVYDAAMSAGLAPETIVNPDQLKEIDAKAVMICNTRGSETNAYARDVYFKSLSNAGKALAAQLDTTAALSGLAWPNGIFALAHVSIPISPDDQFYGNKSMLGTSNAKGEHGVIIMGSDLTRLRYNPFYDLLETSIAQSFFTR